MRRVKKIKRFTDQIDRFAMAIYTQYLTRARACVYTRIEKTLYYRIVPVSFSLFAVILLIWFFELSPTTQ